jgi:tripartite-type tricarboxylate transporter receptor subunit TctC
VALISRRFLLCASAVAAICAASSGAWAQAYPTRPVHLIVPVAAGGPNDTIARIIAQTLPWPQQVYVENLVGAGGNVGTGVAARAPADGHTLVIVSGSFVVNPALYPNTPYDPVKDFAPITMVVTSPHVLVVHPSVPARNVKELVALIKANPGKYSYASPGRGQSGQLAAEIFKLTTGLTDLVHVPFNGAAPAIVSTIGGHTPIAFVGLPAAASNIQDGNLRALAITSSKRSPAFPDVPTMAEAGFPDQESVFPMGLLAPAGTPREIVDLWYREIVRIVALPDVKGRLAALGFEPVANTPAEFSSWIEKEVPRWAKVIRDAKIN